MARDEMILKTLTRILILVVHLCLRGTMEEPTRACVVTFSQVYATLCCLCVASNRDVPEGKQQLRWPSGIERQSLEL